MKKRFLKLFLIYFLPISSILIWFIDRSVNKFILFPENILTYGMQILGLISLSLLSLNFILSVKNRTTEKIIGGLDDQYKIHQRVGKVALTLIVLHIFFGIIRTFAGIASFRLYLIPGADSDYNLGIFAFWSLVLLLILTLVIKLPYRIWKITHTFMILPLILAGIHAYSFSYSPFLVPIISIYAILVTIIGVVCYIYSAFLFSRIGPIHKYKVRKISSMDGIIELFVEPIGKKIEYNAGQYIFLSFLGNKKIIGELHPFAISTAPNEETRITAKIAGDYTETLINAKKGDIVKLIGPFGEFYSDNFKNRNKQAWIAGGIGITPFLSMLREEVKKVEFKKDLKTIYFFYCTKNPAEAVYSKEIMEFSEKHPNLRIFFHCSDEYGFVTAEYLKENIGDDFSDALFMICGPSPMMTGLQKGLMKLDKKRSDIFFENFSFK